MNARASASAGGEGDAVAGVGVHRRAVRVVGDLEAAAFEIGKAVKDVAAVEIGPAGQPAGLVARVARRRREEEDLLPGREDAAAEQIGEDPAEPGPAGEDEAVGAQRLAGRERDVRQRPARPGRRRDLRLAIGAAAARRTRRPGSGPRAAPSARRIRGS